MSKYLPALTAQMLVERYCKEIGTTVDDFSHKDIPSFILHLAEHRQDFSSVDDNQFYRLLKELILLSNANNERMHREEIKTLVRVKDANLKLTLVHNHKDDVQILSDILEKYGIEIVLVSVEDDPDTILRLREKKGPSNPVIIDSNGCTEKAINYIAHINESNENIDIFCILPSDEPQMKEDFFQLGVKDVFVKPVMAMQLITPINELLEKGGT